MARRKPCVAIVGAGCVGKSVGLLLRRGGFRILAVASRTRASTLEGVRFIGQGRAARSAVTAARGAEMVLISTSDDAIEPVCRQIAKGRGFRRGATVFHFSGALGSDALDSARRGGAFVAAVHPIQSFPTAEDGVKRMAGTVFSFEGDAEAEPAARDMVNTLGGRMIRIAPEMKALYHAACCAASNYAVCVTDLALELMESAGIERDQAMAALLPLIRGTVSNMASLGVPAALTGPVARGDVKTLERHLAAMRDLPSAASELYRALALRALDAAQRKGRLPPTAAARMRRVLRGNVGCGVPHQKI